MARKKTVRKKTKTVKSASTMSKKAQNMAKKKILDQKMSHPAKIGGLLFILGVIVAVVVGMLTPISVSSIDGTISASPPPELVSLLTLLGLLVGFFNITRKETQTFLLAGVSLIIAAGIGSSMLGPAYKVGGLLSSMLLSILTFIIPSIIMVALRTIWSLEKD